MSVTIARGSADDLESVMTVMSAAFSDEYGEAWTRSQCSGILPMPGVKLALAKDADSIVGFSLYRTIAGDSELLLLAVAPDSQGDGIGRALLRHFIEDSKADGATAIHLEVRDGNPAVKLYEHAGFERSNRRRDYYRGRGGQYDALTFVLSAKS